MPLTRQPSLDFQPFQQREVELFERRQMRVGHRNDSSGRAKPGLGTAIAVMPAATSERTPLLESSMPTQRVGSTPSCGRRQPDVGVRLAARLVVAVDHYLE